MRAGVRVETDGDVCTIESFVMGICPLVWEKRGQTPSLPDWPPDMFAIAASLLNVTGAYRKVLSHDAIKVDWKAPVPGQTWAREIVEIGIRWRNLYANTSGGRSYPKEVGKWWRTLIFNRHMAIHLIASSSDVYNSLICLMAVSDEACEGIGFPPTSTINAAKSSPSSNLFYFQALDILESHRLSPYGMTLCDLVHPSRARVLPKLHTPQTGLTLRSLSLNLALCPADEVKIKWTRADGWQRKGKIPVGPHEDGLRKHLNLLLIPWPMVIHPADIHAVESVLDGDAHRPQRLFAYSPRGTKRHKGLNIRECAERLLDISMDVVGSEGIDGIILPELAVTSQEYNDLKELANMHDLLLISGIRTHDKSTGYDLNQVGIYLSMDSLEGFGFTADLVQRKHHRWMLDFNQIMSYGLATLLHPDSTWWEGIEIAPRELECLSINEWLNICALICEDLARQEPVSTAVRAIGPSLVIALLMDGPQLSRRWPSHYATVLADDPGSSVLTFTSLGMVKLSHAMRPSSDHKASRTVALWKDRQMGLVEIDLPAGDDAIILCLSNKSFREASADGRIDRRGENLLVLGGVHPIKLADSR